LIVAKLRLKKEDSWPIICPGLLKNKREYLFKRRLEEREKKWGRQREEGKEVHFILFISGSMGYSAYFFCGWIE